MLPLFLSPRRNRPTMVAAAGPRPAAGLLLRHTDPDGTVWYLMAKRAVRLGGTWANVGGSLDHGEAPLTGALREFHEELNLGASALVGGTIASVIECGTDRVPYTLFVVDVPAMFDDAELAWENDELWWIPATEVPALNLHQGFARAWATLHPSEETP